VQRTAKNPHGFLAGKAMWSCALHVDFLLRLAVESTGGHSKVQAGVEWSQFAACHPAVRPPVYGSSTTRKGVGFPSASSLTSVPIADPRATITQ
jgi:hypothetical protein